MACWSILYHRHLDVKLYGKSLQEISAIGIDRDEGQLLNRWV